MINEPLKKELFRLKMLQQKKKHQLLELLTK